MHTHPEQTSTEFYAGNIEPSRLAEFLLDCPSARLGSVAYSVDGDKLSPSEGILPLIIGKADHERYDDLMMTRAFGPHWRQRRPQHPTAPAPGWNFGIGTSGVIK